MLAKTTEFFIPHLQTCEALHQDPDYGKCGEYARRICHDSKGRERYVCHHHYLSSSDHKDNNTK